MHWRQLPRTWTLLRKRRWHILGHKHDKRWNSDIITSQRLNARVWKGNTPDHLPRKSSNAYRHKENWGFTACWDSWGSLLWQSEERISAIYSACHMTCLLIVYSLRWQQTWETTVKRICVVAWQCACCCPQSWIHQQSQVWGIAPPPPPTQYSPNLVPSEHHLFGHLKQMLRGSQFISDEELQKAVQAMEKCSEKQGDYVEKWSNFQF